MTPIPAAPELLATARRVVWFKPPEDALRNPTLFLNHLMVWGTLEDLRVALDHYTEDDLRRALAQPIPGVFDARSWAYWHLRLGLGQPPPLPVRELS